MTTAAELIAHLGLTQHPEGGWYRQTWKSDALNAADRASGTAIFFLLKGDEVSHWHKVDAAEIWHYYAGAPLILSISPDRTGPAVDHLLGPDVLGGQSPQLIVKAEEWQAAKSTGEWTLVGCTVSPAFNFDNWELAEDGFDIPRA